MLAPLIPILKLQLAMSLFMAAGGEPTTSPQPAPAAASPRATKPAERERPAASPESSSVESQQADAAAREVLNTSPFWWKHRSNVDDPSKYLGFLQPIFRALKDGLLWLARGVARVIRFIRSLFAFDMGLSDSAAAARLIAYGLAAVALVFVGWKLYARWRRRPVPAVPLVDDAAHPEQLPNALVLLARAQAAYQAGDHFLALRLAFLALLALLQDRGILRYSRTRTNREYSRDLGGQPVLAANFRRVALPFERARYGNIKPSRLDAEQAIAVCESLLPEKAQAS